MASKCIRACISAGLHYLSMILNGAVHNIQAPNRLALVSLLYGLGNLACRFLLLSVIVSWTIDLTLASNGSISECMSAGPDYLSMIVNGAVHDIPAPDRLALVSSLYGLGNLACWFFLLLSVIVSWTINPTSASNDSITNDFIAALSLPIIAAADFWSQVHQLDGQNLHLLLSTPSSTAVRAAAAIEAPLTVCEDFIMLASVLYAVAAWKCQRKRMVMALAGGWMCFSVEFLLMRNWVPFRSSLLVRPFLFHLMPLLVISLCWYSLTCCQSCCASPQRTMTQNPSLGRPSNGIGCLQVGSAAGWLDALL